MPLTLDIKIAQDMMKQWKKMFWSFRQSQWYFHFSSHTVAQSSG